ncbi:1-phosphofructokinase family hexose kinase [Aurantimicrobium minutum]|uniref:1-phosphofructokinase family hexose kinase n=1 Tax=Aurantimicrobium minutum TaxID=708131 RepID=UPI002476B834|nr:1-phosphofructokinase family hexose kinase [Aurantimicrobium minutum]MDH6423204.1 1-phosphofructokinase [Aurantimicrobium minutum]
MNAVVTLTPAPVLDRTYLAEDLTVGKVNRAYEVHEYMSGKGLNVARTLHLAKHPVSAVLPIGMQDQYLLFSTPFPQILRIMPVQGRVRVNTTVVERGGRTTNINQQAIPFTTEDWRNVVETTLEQVSDMNADWLVVSGMHPKMIDTGLPIDLSELFSRARDLGARVGLDTSGPELKHWGRSGEVNLIKPNADELASLVGHELHTLGDVIDAGRELIATGLEIALVSLGPDGAIAITADDVVWASAVAPEVINTTGAGDAFLAGFLSQVVSPEASAAGRESGTLPALSPEAALTTGCSWGALAVSLPTTLISSFGDAPVAQLREVDPAYSLMEKATVRY